MAFLTLSISIMSVPIPIIILHPKKAGISRLLF